MKMSWRTLLREYADLRWEKKVLLCSALLALIPLIMTWMWPSAPRDSVLKAKSGPGVDTYIPRGFVLVPIEVQNYEALDSVLGRFALVDLYQNGGLVARNVRLLRAPQNPSHFAVLVQESAVPQVLRSGSPFTVILKRPGNSGTEFVNQDTSRRRRIVYEGG